MARNFLIFYWGREGSSAIISTLSGQPEINVPLFEALEKRQLGDAYDSARVAELLDEMFTTGCNPVPNSRDASIFDKDAAARARAQSIGIKLRPPPDMTSVMEIMARHKVQPFILVRTDVTEAVASQLLSEVAQAHDPSFAHPQFKKLAKRPEHWDSFRSEWNQRRATATPSTLRRLLDERLWVMRSQVELALRLRQGGFSPRLLHYSDYTSDPATFVSRVMTALEITSAAAPVLACKLERVNDVPARKRVDRLALSFLHPKCLRSRLRFAAALRELRAVAPRLMT